jgi:SAM-dependent methyltransferase
MANQHLRRALDAVWGSAAGQLALDLSGGRSTSEILTKKGYRVVVTQYRVPTAARDGTLRVAGVDLNRPLPFKDETFDAVNLTEVIEHIENQPQLIREIARVLKADGEVAISTPNVLNIVSRLRFLFTGFVRGRVRPVHYTHGPGEAPNIYLIPFYELYYLLFHSGFEIRRLERTRIKAGQIIFLSFLYPWMWLLSLEAVIHAEKDPAQRRLNWQILKQLFSWPLLLSDNIVVKAKKVASRAPIRP